MRQRVLWQLTILLTLPFALLATDYETLRADYIQAQRTLELERKTQENQLAEFYLNALKRQIDASQANGELDTILALKEEQKRFSRWRRPARRDERSTVPTVLDYQKKLEKAYRSIDTAADKKRNDRLIQHVKALDTYIQELTRDGKIERAMELKESRDELARRIRTKNTPGAAGLRPTPTPTAPPPVRAANEEFHLGDSRYKFVDKIMMWSRANEEAKAAGGQLVVIETAEESAFLTKHTNQQQYWIGAQIEQGGKWTWVDGTPLEQIEGLRINISPVAEKGPLGLTLRSKGDWRQFWRERKNRKIRGYIIEFKKQ